jgi:hypothetical protein
LLALPVFMRSKHQPKSMRRWDLSETKRGSTQEWGQI